MSAVTERPSALASGLALLPPTEAQRWQQSLDNTARPCGCKSGAVFSLSALTGSIVWWAVRGLPPDPVRVGIAVLGSLLVAIAAGLVGKLAGIVVGRQRHRSLQRRLAQRVRALGAVV
jgi:hypothetical protein